MGSSCFARGNDENLEIIEQYIKENNLDTTVEITGSRCDNICTHGPNINIDGVQYYGVDKKKLMDSFHAYTFHNVNQTFLHYHLLD